MARSSAYIEISRHHVYHFRIRVPDHVRHLIPQTYIRRSLQTKCRRETVLRSASMLEQVQILFSTAEQEVAAGIVSLSWKPVERSVEAKKSAKVLEKASPKLSVVLQKYLCVQRQNGIGEKTLGDKKSIVELLIRIVGDLPMNSYQRKHAQAFKEKAMKLPPRTNQKVKGTLDKLIAEATTTISVTTFNNYMKYLTAIFTYAVQEEYCDKNPFEGLKIKQRVKASAGRSRFTEDDLRRLFTSDIYARRDGDKSYQYLNLIRRFISTIYLKLN